MLRIHPEYITHFPKGGGDANRHGWGLRASVKTSTRVRPAIRSPPLGHRLRSTNAEVPGSRKLARGRPTRFPTVVIVIVRVPGACTEIAELVTKTCRHFPHIHVIDDRRSVVVGIIGDATRPADWTNFHPVDHGGLLDRCGETSNTRTLVAGDIAHIDCMLLCVSGRSPARL